MKQLKWEDITVQQFQDIYRLSLSTNLVDIDKVSRIICILFDIDENRIEEMPMRDYKELAKQCAFIMSGEIPGRPVKKIRIGRNRYRINYDPTRLKHRQYCEIVTYGEKPIEQMHMVMASLVDRVTWYGRVIKNKGEDHPTVASHLLQARVMDVYHSCVFFCKMYSNLINSIADSSMHQMIVRGWTKDQAKGLLNLLQSATDGYSLPAK